MAATHTHIPAVNRPTGTQPGFPLGMWMWFYTIWLVHFSNHWTNPLRLLTQETLFLVALATAKRVGELQALSTQVAFQDNNVVLSYLLDFVAKTETPTNPLLGSLCYQVSQMLLAWMTVNGSSVLFGLFDGTFTGHDLHHDPGTCFCRFEIPHAPSPKQPSRISSNN